jgi:hypothetical protein
METNCAIAADGSDSEDSKSWSDDIPISRLVATGALRASAKTAPATVGKESTESDSHPVTEHTAPDFTSTALIVDAIGPVTVAALDKGDDDNSDASVVVDALDASTFVTKVADMNMNSNSETGRFSSATISSTMETVLGRATGAHSNDSVFRDDNGIELYEPANVDYSSFTKENRLHRNVDWLSQEMKDTVDRVVPSAEDIDKNGHINKAKITQAASTLFSSGQMFRNYIQAFQMVNRFALAWGFAITSSGMQIRCSCAQRNFKLDEKVATPERRRERKESYKDIYKCPFYFSTTKVKKYLNSNGPPVAAHPIRFSKFQFEHTCEPSKAQQIHCLKTAGRYAHLFGGRLKEIAKTLLVTDIPTSSLRDMLRQFLPDDCAISSTDIANFRLRCLIYATDIDNADAINAMAEGLLDGKRLDASENQALMSDAVGAKASATLLRTLQQRTDDGFAAVHFLNNLKDLFDGFDFRISRNVKGEVNGLVWMTIRMRADWIRYGEILQLDALKKQMNNLQWPYIGPVVITNENRVAVVCEAIVIGETFDAYGFVLHSLEAMEPRRRLSTVKAVHSDCFLNQECLNEIGLSSAHLIWDHYHLLNQIWPRKIAPQPFARIRRLLQWMLNASSEQMYKQAFETIRLELGENSAEVRYLERFYCEPERFAQYCIDKIEGNLGKVSSAHAEQNHSSISRYFSGKKSAMEVHFQICDLLKRQREINTKRDRLAKNQFYTRNVGDDDAKKVLSDHCYKNLWTVALHDSKNYQIISSDRESATVQRIGYSASRVLRTDERCNCEHRFRYSIQCVHEIVVNDGKFDRMKFHPRHYQADHQDFSLFVASTSSMERPSEPSVDNPSGALTEAQSNDDGDISDGDGMDNAFDMTGDSCADNAFDTMGDSCEETPDRPVRSRRKLGYCDVMRHAESAVKAANGNEALYEKLAGLFIAAQNLLTGKDPQQVRDCDFCDLINDCSVMLPTKSRNCVKDNHTISSGTS